MKTFIICSSEFLPSPPDRDPDSIYFLYDTLDVYFGRTQYSGLYCIVAELPDSSTPDRMPVKNMMYIKMDGDIWKVDNDSLVKIAQLADPTQAEYLVRAGESFLLRSGYRYIDHQTKVLSLPYRNGSFQLSVMVDKPISIDENTIIVYNPETGEFEIDGNRYYDEFGRNPEILKYRAEETNTVKTFIQNDHIHADVKISPKVGNIIHVRPDGLYANTEEFVSVQEYNDLVNRTRSQINAFEHFMDEMRDTLAHVDITLSDQTLANKIYSVLEEYKPIIGDAIENYEETIAEFKVVQSETVRTIIEDLHNLREEVIEELDELDKPWHYFIDSFETTIEKVAPTQYTLTTSIIVVPPYQLYYKRSSEKIYFYHGQAINTSEFTPFASGDTINASPGDIINIVYCNTNSGTSLVNSCSYCTTE